MVAGPVLQAAAVLLSTDNSNGVVLADGKGVSSQAGAENSTVLGSLAVSPCANTAKMELSINLWSSMSSYYGKRLGRDKEEKKIEETKEEEVQSHGNLSVLPSSSGGGDSGVLARLRHKASAEMRAEMRADLAQ